MLIIQACLVAASLLLPTATEAPPRCSPSHPFLDFKQAARRVRAIRQATLVTTDEDRAAIERLLATFSVEASATTARVLAFIRTCDNPNTLAVTLACLTCVNSLMVNPDGDAGSSTALH